MTIEEKVIANLKYAIRWNDKPTQKSMEVAIASLEAWKLVRQEIISERNHRRDRGHHEQSTGLSKAIDIIDRHLKEVEE